MHADNRVTSGKVLLSVGFIAGILTTLGGTHLWGNASADVEHVPMQAHVLAADLQGKEHGAWLWTQVLRMTPVYRDSVIETAKQNGITAIYLQIDSYLNVLQMKDAKARSKQIKLFNSIVADFIAAANKNGIAVDAEAGSPNWAEEGQTHKAPALLAYVKEFNRTHAAKFRGFQYDIEPHVLPRYAEHTEVVLTNFLTLIDQTVTDLQGSDLQFSVAIPEFFEAAAQQSPKFSYNGTSGHTLDHLLSILERKPGSTLLLMAYRDTALGKNGTIELSKDEIKQANDSRTKIIIAVEVGDVGTPGISFYRKPRAEYLAHIQYLQNAFASEGSFAGIATDHLEALQEL